MAKEAKVELSAAEQPDFEGPKYTITMDEVPEAERTPPPEGETKSVEEVVAKLGEALDKTTKDVKEALKSAVAPGTSIDSLVSGVTQTLMMTFAANLDIAMRPKVEAQVGKKAPKAEEPKVAPQEKKW